MAITPPTQFTSLLHHGFCWVSTEETSVASSSSSVVSTQDVGASPTLMFSFAAAAQNKKV
jgi:hypothetical protein